jgi:hypothetical protein
MQEKEYMVNTVLDKVDGFESIVYSKPDKKSKTVIDVEAGDCLVVIGESPKNKGFKYSWYEVQNPWNASQKGWIYGAFLDPIEKITLSEAEKRFNR